MKITKIKKMKGFGSYFLANKEAEKTGAKHIIEVFNDEGVMYIPLTIHQHGSVQIYDRDIPTPSNNRRGFIKLQTLYGHTVADL